SARPESAGQGGGFRLWAAPPHRPGRTAPGLLRGRGGGPPMRSRTPPRRRGEATKNVHASRTSRDELYALAPDAARLSHLPPRASTFPFTIAPSAIERRGVTMSPSTDAVGCSTTRSCAVRLPVTAPLTVIVFAVRSAFTSAPGPIIRL